MTKTYLSEMFHCSKWSIGGICWLGPHTRQYSKACLLFRSSTYSKYYSILSVLLHSSLDQEMVNPPVVSDTCFWNAYLVIVSNASPANIMNWLTCLIIMQFFGRSKQYQLNPHSHSTKVQGSVWAVALSLDGINQLSQRKLNLDMVEYCTLTNELYLQCQFYLSA